MISILVCAHCEYGNELQFIKQNRSRLKCLVHMSIITYLSHMSRLL
jgi:hypothetical protein